MKNRLLCALCSRQWLYTFVSVRRELVVSQCYMSIEFERPKLNATKKLNMAKRRDHTLYSFFSLSLVGCFARLWKRLVLTDAIVSPKQPFEHLTVSHAYTLPLKLFELLFYFSANTKRFQRRAKQPNKTRLSEQNRKHRKNSSPHQQHESNRIFRGIGGFVGLSV